MALLRLGISASVFDPDLLMHSLAVVSVDGGDGNRRVVHIERLSNDPTVMDLATSRDEVQWPPFAVDHGVDLRRAAAATDADRLILLPFCAARGATDFYGVTVDQVQAVTRVPCQAVEKSSSICRVKTNIEALYAVVRAP